MWNLFLEQGSNPCPRHWQADSHHPLHHQGSPVQVFHMMLWNMLFLWPLFIIGTKYSRCSIMSECVDVYNFSHFCIFHTLHEYMLIQKLKALITWVQGIPFYRFIFVFCCFFFWSHCAACSIWSGLWLGIELCTQQLKHKVLTTGLPGNSLDLWLSVRFSGLEIQGQCLQLAKFVEWEY